MKPALHHSAEPSLYDREAESYDLFNEKNSQIPNWTIAGILSKRGSRSVLDLACGTGSQVFWLAKRGFAVTGCDISPAMLGLARRKAKSTGLPVRLIQADMRTFRGGSFDAVLTIGNAVGHLTRSDFVRAMRNIRRTLASGGAFLFDIFNLDCLRTGDNITKLTIDWAKREGGRGQRQVQYSTIDADGVLRSFTTCMKGSAGRVRTSTRVETLQVYSAGLLRDLLHRTGFRRVRHVGLDGARFVRTRTERMLTIAE